jgi:DNA-binding transcriptional ArsR family regulator
MASTRAQNCTALANLNSTPMPKSTLSQHFKILREAGLIRSERKGVELKNSPRWDEYATRFGPMIKGIIEAYATELTVKKRPAPRQKRA